MKPTDKQLKYALFLLDKAGYSTKYMDARYKELGATMRERSGLVTDWLGNLSSIEISKLIDRLKIGGVTDWLASMSNNEISKLSDRLKNRGK